MVAIDLPAEVEHRLEAIAQRTGQSPAAFAREAVIEHLEDLEDLFLAEQQRNEIRAGQLKTIPLEDIVRQYGVED